MMNTASLLSRITTNLTEPTRPGFDTDGLNTWLTTLTKLKDGVEAAGVEEERIVKDRGLSDDGKRNKLADLAGRVVENFAWLGRVLTQADEARNRLTKLLFDPITARPKGDAIIQYLREQEIRHALGSVSQSDRDATFLLALNQDDTETACALLDAPGPDWISEDIRRRGQNAYAQRTNPTAMARLHALEYLREHLSSLAEQTAMWLVTLGATPEAVQQAVKAKD